jgi:hypothetical protein
MDPYAMRKSNRKVVIRNGRCVTRNGTSFGKNLQYFSMPHTMRKSIKRRRMRDTMNQQGNFTAHCKAERALCEYFD